MIKDYEENIEVKRRSRSTPIQILSKPFPEIKLVGLQSFRKVESHHLLSDDYLCRRSTPGLIETFSAYARTILGGWKRPDVE